MSNCHKKLTAMAVVLGALLLAVAACQDSPADPATLAGKALGATPQPVDPVEITDPVLDPDDSQIRLAEMWAESDVTQYETITGTIMNPGLGGKIQGSVPSWPGCEFKIEFGPGVLSGTRPRTFEMRVPLPHQSGGVYYQFEERGASTSEPFNGMAVVTIHWPSTHPRPKPWFHANCLDRSDADGDGVYEYSLSPDVLCYQPDFQSSLLVFRLPHFSRWPVENGKNGGD